MAVTAGRFISIQLLNDMGRYTTVLLQTYARHSPALSRSTRPTPISVWRWVMASMSLTTGVTVVLGTRGTATCLHVQVILLLDKSNTNS